MAITTEVIRRITIHGSTQGVDQATAALNKLAAAQGNVGVVSDESAKRSLSAAAAYKRQTLLLDEGARAQDRIAKATRAADAALQQGIISLVDHAKRLELINRHYSTNGQVVDIAGARYQQLGAHMDKATTAGGLMRHEVINLSRQIQDVGVSISGGQSPFRILVEQGTQIADVFASSRATMGGFFSQTISWAGRFVTSTAGVVTGVVAIGAGAAYAALSWKSAQTDIERSLVGIGERSGLTVAAVNKIAESASSTTRLSMSAAREAATEFIKTGKVYEQNVAAAVNITDKFALAMGQNSTEAAKDLASHLSDVNKGAETLDRSFGFLDGKTREYLRSLVAQNREQEAQALLLEKAAPAIEKAANATSLWAKAWMAVSKAASESVEIVGKAVAQGTEFEAQRPEGRQRQGSPGRVMAQGLRGELPDLTSATNKAVEYEQALLKAAEAAADSRFNEFSKQADDAVRALIPQITQIDNLKASLADLKRAQEEAKVSGRMGLSDQLNAAAQAGQLLKRTLEENVEKTNRQVTETLKLTGAYQEAGVNIIRMGDAYRNVSVETALTLRAQQDQLDLAKAVTVQEKIIAQEKATSNRLALEGVNPAEALKIAAKERLIAETQLTAQHKLNMAALEDQLKVAQALPGHAQQVAQMEADINARLREGATLMQAQEEAAMKRAIAVAQANQAVDQQIRSIRQAMELEQARLDGNEAAVLAAQAYDNAIRSGADSTKAAALAAITLEQAELKAAIAAERVARAAQDAALAWGQAALKTGQTASNAAQLSAKLAAIGTVSYGIPAGQYIDQWTTPIIHTVAGGGPTVGAAGMSTSLVRDAGFLGASFADAATAEMDKIYATARSAAGKQQQAAQSTQEAAQSAARAAESAAEAAKAAREAMIQGLDDQVKEIVATRLLAGQTPQQVNAAIEAGKYRSARRRLGSKHNLISTNALACRTRRRRPI